jgi:hypothetical protein
MKIIIILLLCAVNTQAQTSNLEMDAKAYGYRLAFVINNEVKRKEVNHQLRLHPIHLGGYGGTTGDF